MQIFLPEIGNSTHFIQKNWGLDKNMGNTSSELTPFELFLKYHQIFNVSYDVLSERGLGKM